MMGLEQEMCVRLCLFPTRMSHENSFAEAKRMRKLENKQTKNQHTHKNLLLEHFSVAVLAVP